MFDHVTIRVADVGAAERFYDTVLAALGFGRSSDSAGLPEWDDFSLAAADDQSPVTRGLHVGFVAPSREAVDEFWRAGVAAGYRDDGEPGPRPQYSPDYYGGFLLDPDGNSAEAVHRADAAQWGHDRPSLDPRSRRRGVQALLRERRPPCRLPAGLRQPRASALRWRERLVLPGGGHADRAGAHRLPGGRRERRRLSPRPHRGRAIPTTARPASGRSTTRATTPPSCWTPTGTTSSWSTTTVTSDLEDENRPWLLAPPRWIGIRSGHRCVASPSPPP